MGGSQQGKKRTKENGEKWKTPEGKAACPSEESEAAASSLSHSLYSAEYKPFVNISDS